jgi:hypothetical protein
MDPDRPPEHDALMESSRSRILWLVVLPLVSAAAIAWWLQGEQVEMFGTDKNFSLPIAENNATTIGVLGVVVGGLVLVQFVRHQLRFSDLRFVLASAFIGICFGIGSRGLTMTTAGANIGGGIFLLVGIPILLIATAAVSVRVIRTPTI